VNPDIRHAIPMATVSQESWCYDACMAEDRTSANRHTARLGLGGRLTVPDELREQLGWGEGMTLELTIASDASLIVKPAAVEDNAASPDREAKRLAALRAAWGMWRDRDDLDPTLSPPDEREHENARRS
jgi:bifunctional DNA-binding transcriptional regulator/antitoxin component of YhaV-PrlF toxin-antitoxin module